MMVKQRRITKSYFDFACRKYQPLINKLVFQTGCNSQQEEFINLATLELLKCLICYNNTGSFYVLENGTTKRKATSSFMTFLYNRIRWALKHAKNHEIKYTKASNISPEALKTIETGENDNVADNKILVEDLMKTLLDDERIVIRQIFFGGKTIRETAKDCGMFDSTVFRLKKRAIDKMKRVGNI